MPRRFPQLSQFAVSSLLALLALIVGSTVVQAEATAEAVAEADFAPFPSPNRVTVAGSTLDAFTLSPTAALPRRGDTFSVADDGPALTLAQEDDMAVALGAIDADFGGGFPALTQARASSKLSSVIQLVLWHVASGYDVTTADPSYAPAAAELVGALPNAPWAPASVVFAVPPSPQAGALAVLIPLEGPPPPLTTSTTGPPPVPGPSITTTTVVTSSTLASSTSAIRNTSSTTVRPTSTTARPTSTTSRPVTTTSGRNPTTALSTTTSTTTAVADGGAATTTPPPADAPSAPATESTTGPTVLGTQVTNESAAAPTNASSGGGLPWVPVLLALIAASGGVIAVVARRS